jgi:outer membrane protein assembly factor BamB
MDASKLLALSLGIVGMLLLSGCGHRYAVHTLAKSYSEIVIDEDTVYLNDACAVTAIDKEYGRVKWIYDKENEFMTCKKEQQK